MKFELDNPTGSHKVRAARFIVAEAIEQGLIVPGRSTVIEKTGGNFGLGLVLACAQVNVPVELAVGLSFSPLKRRYLERLGARLIGTELLKEGATPRQVLEDRLASGPANGKSYYYPDQFNNPACVRAHELETGREVAWQLAQDPQLRAVHLVVCAGTGAHLTGIGRALLDAGYRLEVTLVEPAGCNTREGIFIDHPFEGMSVGVRPPLLDWDLVNQTAHVSTESMDEARNWFAIHHGFWVGTTSAACLAVARDQARDPAPNQAVLTLAYDHGLWYPLDPVAGPNVRRTSVKSAAGAPSGTPSGRPGCAGYAG